MKLKTICLPLALGYLSFSQVNAQVLVGWDTVNVAGQITGIALNNGTVLVSATSNITYELGFWSNTIDLSSKTSIIAGFTAWGTQGGADYFGTVGEDGLGDGLLGKTNGNAVIPTGWVGLAGNTVGILFGRNQEQWGAFRFDLYPTGGTIGSTTFPANSLPPASPAQMDYFTFDMISSAGVIAGSIQTSNALPFTQYGDMDPETAGTQYLESSGTVSLVPEPSTGALLMIGAAGLVALRRLRKV